MELFPRLNRLHGWLNYGEERRGGGKKKGCEGERKGEEGERRGEERRGGEGERRGEERRGYLRDGQLIPEDDFFRNNPLSFVCGL